MSRSTLSEGEFGNVPAHCLVVVHIPKTAGTSLLSIVRRQYAPERTVEFKGPDWAQQIARFQTASHVRLDHIRCLMGHVPFGVHRLLPQPVTYITMLRDPVEWTLSLYYALLTKPQYNPGLRVVAQKRLSLEAFVDYLAEQGRSNVQTRFVGGFHSIGEIFQPSSPLTQESLTTARANLAAMFSAVGLVEFFDESVLLMKRALAWRNVYYTRQNVTADRPREVQVTERQRQRILDLHALDAALYESARRDFQVTMENLGSDLSRELRTYRRINNLYGRAQTWYRRGRVLAGQVKRRILHAGHQ